jgi:hypothetical protein
MVPHLRKVHGQAMQVERDAPVELKSENPLTYLSQSLPAFGGAQRRQRENRFAFETKNTLLFLCLPC